jgi:hypothetical protein
MSLYGRTDSAGDITKAERTVVQDSLNDATVGVPDGVSEKQVLFIDETEAQLAENIARGLNSPGYWAYFEYTDVSGETRHKADLLVALADADINANETQADDQYAADVSATITFTSIAWTVPDANGDFVVGDAAPNAADVVATVDGGGTVLYEWQRRSPASGRWTRITATLDGAAYVGFNTPQLTIQPSLWATDNSADGYEYRVKLNSDNGATEVFSTVLTLTEA